MPFNSLLLDHWIRAEQGKMGAKGGFDYAHELQWEVYTLLKRNSQRVWSIGAIAMELQTSWLVWLAVICSC